MKTGRIKTIKAREILDSKGSPTLEVELRTPEGNFYSSVPSGVSEGKYEALELRDGGKRYGGAGVEKAVRVINEKIAPKLIEKNARNQKQIDELMIKIDGTRNKSRLGANAILGVSMALCRAGAFVEKLPLYQYISKLAKNSSWQKLPGPFMLMIEGGAHGGNDLDIQEFMMVPEGKSFKEKLRVGVEVYQALKEILRERYGEMAINVGYEGGFAPPLKENKKTLKLILEAGKKTGYKDRIKFVLDIAAPVFYKRKRYKFEGKNFNRKNLGDFYLKLLKKYSILALEDPFSEDDWQGWRMLAENCKLQIANFLIIGDDLLATNPERIKWAKEKKLCNSAIIKIDQIGTITEAIEAVRLAKSYKWKTIVAHRSGETNDDFIADFAVGVNADYVKFGAPNRGERIVKYNRLLKIEEEIS